MISERDQRVTSTSWARLETECRDALTRLLDSERKNPEGTLLALGFSIGREGLPPWSQLEWCDDGSVRRVTAVQEEIIRQLRGSQGRYGTVSLNANPSLRTADIGPLLLSYIREDFGEVGPVDLLVWGVTRRDSNVGFTPMRIRQLWHLVKTELRFALDPQTRINLARALISAGDVSASLEFVKDATRASAAILWTYNPIDRAFRSENVAGIAKARSYVVKSDYGSRSAAPYGIVSRVRPEEPLVAFDSLDPAMWYPPGIEQWQPHDLDLFRSEGWRSCVAWPVTYCGRLIGALSIYATSPVNQLIPKNEQRTEYADLFVGVLEAMQISRLHQKLTDSFDDEISRASVSVLALGYIHDVSKHLEQLNDYLEQAELEAAAHVRDSPRLGALATELGRMRSVLDKLDPIVEQMSHFSQTRRDNAEGPRCDPAATLLELQDFLVMLARRESPRVRRVEFDGVRVPPGAVVIDMPRTRFERVVVNLVTNASQWGATSIKVSLKSVSKSGRKVQLEVSNNGVRIASEEIPRIFDLFETSRSGGSGLGLYLVRRFVREAGGTVGATSSDAETVFTVTVPASLESR